MSTHLCALCGSYLSLNEVEKIKQNFNSSCGDCKCEKASQITEKGKEPEIENNECSGVSIKNCVCYSCNKLLNETKNTALMPPYVIDNIQQLRSAKNNENLREQIKEFLIEEEE